MIHLIHELKCSVYIYRLCLKPHKSTPQETIPNYHKQITFKKYFELQLSSFLTKKNIFDNEINSLKIL